MQTTSENRVIMKDNFVEIILDSAQGIIIARWKGFLTVDQVKRGCSVINEQVTRHRLTKHLSDHSQLRVLSKEVQDYLGAIWFNQVEQLGLRKLAVILGEDVFAVATVKKVNGQQKFGQMTLNTFASYDTSYKWINS